MRRTMVAVLAAAAAALVTVGSPAARADEPGRRDEIPFSTALRIGARLATGDDPEFAAIGPGKVDNTTCATAGNPLDNIDLSCDDDFSPENETSIVVNPANPDHLLAGSNDYHISRRGDGSLRAVEPTGFFVSFDGGTTWVDGQVPSNSGTGFNGDPAPAFNRKFGTAHMAQLTISCGALCGSVGLTVATSYNGGLAWESPVIVAHGQGSITPNPRGVFNDKEWLAADNTPTSPHYGRLYMTWTRFRGTDQGWEGPIYLSYSDDAGKTWSTGKEISGSNPALCTVPLFGEPGKCNDDQFSVPVVLADGTVVVHFANWQNGATWELGEEYESQLLAVRSTDGGETWSPPVQIAALEDGSGDYPENVDGRNTQTGHQFRTATAAGMTLDEVTGDLWAFWTDNTDGARDVPGAVPVTTTNVFLSRSGDGGRSWSTPIRVTTGNGDRWMPWAGARNGVVRVMYMDGSYDFPARNGYGVTLSSSNGGLTWTHEPVHTQLSNPDAARYFKAGAAAPGCETCSTFIGDYNGLAIDSLGRTHLIWTDMRRTVTYNSRTGHVEDVIYARR